MLPHSPASPRLRKPLLRRKRKQKGRRSAASPVGAQHTAPHLGRFRDKFANAKCAATIHSQTEGAPPLVSKGGGLESSSRTNKKCGRALNPPVSVILLRTHRNNDLSQQSRAKTERSRRFATRSNRA